MGTSQGKSEAEVMEPSCASNCWLDGSWTSKDRTFSRDPGLGS